MPTVRPHVTVKDAAAWSSWLTANAATSNGVWITIARKGIKEPTSLSHDEVVDEVLCHGWIDSQGAKRDDTTRACLCTPRTERSAWSKRNVEKATRLEAEGRMTPSGQAAVAAAKADGRWDTAIAEAPADLLEAINADPEALTAWDGLNKTKRYPIFYQLAALKTDAGRKKRIATYVAGLVQSEASQPSKHHLNDQVCPQKKHARGSDTEVGHKSSAVSVPEITQRPSAAHDRVLRSRKRSQATEQSES